MFDQPIYMPDELGSLTLIDLSPRLSSTMNPDIRVVQAARISTNRNTKGSDKDKGLIEYMVKNRHTSPFEMVEWTILVDTPIFVARQWMRHRTFSFNEVSRRFTDEQIDSWIPQQLSKQSQSNRQGRAETLGVELNSNFTARWRQIVSDAQALYADMTANGVAREMARGVLPVALRTKFFAKTDMHNLLHFISLRHHEHAQHEIRVYAYTLWRLVQKYAPLTAGAYEQFRFDNEQKTYNNAFIDRQMEGLE